MENLSISDAPPAAPPPQGSSQAGGPPQPPPQLPPQMFTTAAQLLDLTDKKLMVVLRDGRKLIGVLRSWDQFANIVLQSTTERIFAANPDSARSDTAPRGLFADIPHGIFLVRGENVLLLGEIDLDRDDDPPPGYEPAELELVKRLADEHKALEKARDKSRFKKLAKMGFEGESQGEIVLG
ncbi:hypothetical protein JDV02_005948 [Purpureocillium takamizusanense]|uniref:U6 snRNA-associated Sm-like protein LSm1 n=1 Tax=Purpureocillium takamizusanense TaxID=2060973 RepID=A0A9Q8QIE6_9HYPO|nr:uncharacterized protein JDV02_005948 [Purpureocillium takamizusanense]UNI19797.1 hypothetical protein JDV02_005948 [Purpureocillium takamizusanense]